MQVLHKPVPIGMPAAVTRSTVSGCSRTRSPAQDSNGAAERYSTHSRPNNSPTARALETTFDWRQHATVVQQSICHERSTLRPVTHGHSAGYPSALPSGSPSSSRDSSQTGCGLQLMREVSQVQLSSHLSNSMASNVSTQIAPQSQSPRVYSYRSPSPPQVLLQKSTDLVAIMQVFPQSMPKSQSQRVLSSPKPLFRDGSERLLLRMPPQSGFQPRSSPTRGSNGSASSASPPQACFREHLDPSMLRGSSQTQLPPRVHGCPNLPFPSPTSPQTCPRGKFEPWTFRMPAGLRPQSPSPSPRLCLRENTAPQLQGPYMHGQPSPPQQSRHRILTDPSSALAGPHSPSPQVRSYVSATQPPPRVCLGELAFFEILPPTRVQGFSAPHPVSLSSPQLMSRESSDAPSARTRIGVAPAPTFDKVSCPPPHTASAKIVAPQTPSASTSSPRTAQWTGLVQANPASLATKPVIMGTFGQESEPRNVAPADVFNCDPPVVSIQSDQVTAERSVTAEFSAGAPKKVITFGSIPSVVDIITSSRPSADSNVAQTDMVSTFSNRSTGEMVARVSTANSVATAVSEIWLDDTVPAKQKRIANTLTSKLLAKRVAEQLEATLGQEEYRKDEQLQEPEAVQQEELQTEVFGAPDDQMIDVFASRDSLAEPPLTDLFQTQDIDEAVMVTRVKALGQDAVFC